MSIPKKGYLRNALLYIWAVVAPYVPKLIARIPYSKGAGPDFGDKTTRPKL